MKKRTIAVFTGNRAEYGLQQPILKAIDDHPYLEYKLIVSGAHLEENFGETLQEIEQDGFTVHKEVSINLQEDTLFATSLAIGSGIVGVSKALAEIQPDFFVVYADRFEGFAAVIAASQMNIPTAHIEGGDITEGGALDDSVRHAMTKLSHLHFTTNEQATARILGMGEEEWRVHTVGFPAMDLVQRDEFATPKELCEQFGIDLERPVVIYTQHSVTTEFDQAKEQVTPCLDALVELAQSGVQVICTYPNNDAGGRKIIQLLTDLEDTNPINMQFHQSLGRYRYHGLLALAKDKKLKVACVGNSSSGIKETPAFQCPTVNVGSRQDSRLRGENVIDCGYNTKDLKKAILKCFHDEEFRNTCQVSSNPYGVGQAGKKVADILANVKIDESFTRKKMTLAGVTRDGWFR